MKFWGNIYKDLDETLVLGLLKGMRMQEMWFWNVVSKVTSKKGKKFDSAQATELFQL